MVAAIFLPLVSLSGFQMYALAQVLQYFTLSGLSTDLGLLNTGKSIRAKTTDGWLIGNSLVRDNMGVHNCHLRSRFHGQIWWLYTGGKVRRLQLARGWHYRFLDELQRVSLAKYHDTTI